MSVPKEYKATITREQFLFLETRIIARLQIEGNSKKEILDRCISENLLEMPTEKSIAVLTRSILRKLDCVDEGIVKLIATADIEIAKQANLYAMMCFNRIVWDFMIHVIGRKYETFDLTFAKSDVNLFFKSLQEQNEQIASWSDSTVERIKNILIKMLCETEYLDSIKSETLNPVYLDDSIKEIIEKCGDEIVLPAFNCLR